MQLQRFFIILTIFFIQINLNAQTKTVREYTAGETGKAEITIDGNLNEEVWKNVEWQGDFIQYEPYEGKKPYQETMFAILIDENYVYVAFKAFDSSPDSVIRRLSRRDQFEGDIVAVQFDSYFDKRTAFSFMVNAAGIKNDFIVSNDGGNEDNTWDPIWHVKTSIDEKGWYAEMRIPLTQLRFENSGEHTWGLQLGRLIFRKQELVLWQPASKKQSGWVSHYGLLKGLTNLKSRKIADLTPYIVARTDRFEKEPANPFMKNGHSSKLNAGIDGKLGVTNNLTLDFTINPDFGQIEADPSEVNLTSFETFFREKRPFFIEGKNILSFPLMFGDGGFASENLFYSRRIGRRPHNSPELNDGEYEDSPEFTRILGAAKLTGKTKTGWSIGVLESMTTEEFAKISNGTDRKEMIEPFTNYSIARIQKDFNEGNTFLGGMFTAVNRNLSEEQFNYLHKSAYTGGIDFVHKWQNKKWEFNLSSYFSRVDGSEEAISTTQKSWIHGFQRPDATHLSFDSTRTSLIGQGGKLVFSKNDGNLKFMIATSWKSPGLELNDVGYMRQTDNILEVAWVGYRIYEPFSIFRNYNINFNQYTEWNFAGESTGKGGNINMHTTLKNYWSFHLGGNLNGEGLSTTKLRGGPAIILPGTKNLWFAFGSNEQKKLTGEFEFMTLSGMQNGTRKMNNYEISLGYRPSNSLKITISPEYTTNNDQLQYVTQKEYKSKTDYIFARINQKTISASIRINYNITPDLSLQYWGQPFIASGKYSEFKRITNSRADTYNQRFMLIPEDELVYSVNDEQFTVLSKEQTKLYSFGQPDFNVKEFLSNMVIRWEYTPGSTLFLVWSQSRNQSASNGSFNFNKDIETLFDKKPYNVFLLKLSYRIGR